MTAWHAAHRNISPLPELIVNGLYLAIYICIVYNIEPLDYTSVRVKLNSLGLGVGISPPVALVSIELHSLELGS